MDDSYLLHHADMMNQEVAQLLSARLRVFVESTHTDLERNLKEADPIPKDKTLGYMPRHPAYKPETPGADAIETVTLDHVIDMPTTTSTTLPESGRMDVDGILKEKGVNTNREKTEDENSKDHKTSHKSTHGDSEGRTRPTSSRQDISEAPLGDPLHTPYVIRHDESSQPKKDSNDALVFRKDHQE
ncbi:hypothetical protein MJO28_015769 [Puccinia striiformis f. sp. tritici]|uniref:Uncharacterized protein n=1 Tax=Puccinia striiformis f. sp. tritici TaxID=168172 RepID=A0ACC0DRL1_9BASI|nr:hypothetical protein MJO29_015622 [Puccinia striiformis f. sp. tritici]KAI7936870.1 hypothetical protein MJO28_015769 [Puccinia striiformis f. sp. tritici]